VCVRAAGAHAIDFLFHGQNVHSGQRSPMMRNLLFFLGVFQCAVHVIDAIAAGGACRPALPRLALRCLELPLRPRLRNARHALQASWAIAWIAAAFPGRHSGAHDPCGLLLFIQNVYLERGS